jgi:hypothetical protein
MMLCDGCKSLLGASHSWIPGVGGLVVVFCHDPAGHGRCGSTALLLPLVVVFVVVSLRQGRVGGNGWRKCDASFLCLVLVGRRCRCRVNVVLCGRLGGNIRRECKASSLRFVLHRRVGRVNE